MTSQSRAAQGKLTELDKTSAPFLEQLFKAAEFIGVNLETVGRSSIEKKENEKRKAVIYYGKEEWLLRWLLKKLQAPDDAVPRLTPSSWWLFCHLIRSIPLPVVARLLIERKFTAILRSTLEDAQEKIKELSNTYNDEVAESSSDRTEPSRPSKKRKRSAGSAPEPRMADEKEWVPELLTAVHQVLAVITQASKATIVTSEKGKSAAFHAEYMKTALKAPAQEAAIILGQWFSFTSQTSKLQYRDVELSWFSPFVDIWNARIADDSVLVLFSRHCLSPLMALIRDTQDKETDFNIAAWKTQMEQLVARNVMIPAKAARIEKSDSDLLPMLIRIPIIQVTANAPIFFDVAIRCISTRGNQRRRPEDEVWLQHVFSTVQDALLPQRPNENTQALCTMLESAKKFKVLIDLSTLRTITTQFAFGERHTEWQLLARLIALDANVFLIPDDEVDLLGDLLQRITRACFDTDWASIIDPVVMEVLVPLMREFAHARDLSGFLHHWHAELVKFEQFRSEKKDGSMNYFCAWESEALQAELSSLFVQNLTINQINQALDWLQASVGEASNATCVILEAIAGSIKTTDTEVVDAVNMRLFNIMFQRTSLETLNPRYRWRAWKMFSHNIKWAAQEDLTVIAQHWIDGKEPFEALASEANQISLLKTKDNHKVKLDALQILRCACALWSCAKNESQLAVLSRPVVLDFLDRIARELRTFPADLTIQGEEYGQSICGQKQDTVRRDLAWMMWSFVRCIFVEYPKVLTLIPEMKSDTPKAFLQNILWLASGSENTHFAWFRLNSEVWPALWTSALQNDYTLDSPALIGLMIDVMLQAHGNYDNPCRTGLDCSDIFALRSLQCLPLDLYSRDQREYVLAHWHLCQQTTELTKKRLRSYQSTVAALHPALLALKVKVARRSALYEGMSFKHLVDMTEALALLSGKKHTNGFRLPDARDRSEDHQFKPCKSLFLLKEYIRLTLSQTLDHIEQPHRQEYVSGAIELLKQTIETSKSPWEQKHWTFPFIALADTIFTTLQTKLSFLAKLRTFDVEEWRILVTNFKECLLTQFGKSLDQGMDSQEEDKNSLLLLCTIDALASIGVEVSELKGFKEKVKAFVKSSDSDLYEVVKKVELFFAVHGGEVERKRFGTRIKGDVSTAFGRESIVEKVEAATAKKSKKSKLKLLSSMLGEDLSSFTDIDKLLAVRQVIILCEDARALDDLDENKLDLTMIYSILCGQLWKAQDIRHFCIISETMEMMIRTKRHCMTQWNIDSTLGAITTTCSRNGPSLRARHTGAIFLHLCRLLQAILISHRLKLQGHFHLVVQAMQALLRCIFIPLPHSTSTKIFDPPPWIPSEPKSPYHLTASHAAAYTRLLTLICDPTHSSVTRSQHHSLTSATDKAKRIAGQHMQFVLISYIRLQLEMNMKQEVRESLMPGWWALLGTMTTEGRRTVGEGIDANGRELLKKLVGEWVKFGKWKGG